MGCFLALPIRFLGQKWRRPLSGICCSLRKAPNSLISPVCFIKTNSKFFWIDKPGLKKLYWVKMHICLLTEKHQHKKIKLVDYLCCFLGSSSPSGSTDKSCVILGEGTKFPFLDFRIQEFLKKNHLLQNEEKIYVNDVKMFHFNPEKMLGKDTS